MQKIKQVTRWQDDNSFWNLMRKDVISGSKSHDVRSNIDACRSEFDSIVLFYAIHDGR